MFLERKLARTVQHLSRSFSVLMLTGPRQAGKTTLLRHLDPDRRFVTLDDLEQRTLARGNPSLFLERYPPPVLIDEFQYAPGLLPFLKMAVDEKRTRLIPSQGEYWLTGSQNFVMMEGVQESLAGRVAILKLLGLDRSEVQRDTSLRNHTPFFDRPRERFETRRGLAELYALILKGDKPEIWAAADSRLRPVDTSHYYASYVQTYLERDVRSQLGVKELGLFEKFMRLLATRAGQLLNMSALASDVGITIPTIKSWLTILERGFQIILLRPYYRNLTSRQVKTPKVFFLDTGLVAHLLKWSDPEQALSGPMAGALFENWVVSEIIKGYWHLGQDPALYFWRTREGMEVDLVLEKGDELLAAEIKLTERPDPRFFLPLEGLFAKKGRRPLVRLGAKRIISPVKQNHPLDRNLELISAWSL